MPTSRHRQQLKSPTSCAAGPAMGRAAPSRRLPPAKRHGAAPLPPSASADSPALPVHPQRRLFASRRLPTPLPAVLFRSPRQFLVRTARPIPRRFPALFLAPPIFPPIAAPFHAATAVPTPCRGLHPLLFIAAHCLGFRSGCFRPHSSRWQAPPQCRPSPFELTKPPPCSDRTRYLEPRLCDSHLDRPPSLPIPAATAPAAGRAHHLGLTGSHRCVLCFTVCLTANQLATQTVLSLLLTATLFGPRARNSIHFPSPRARQACACAVPAPTFQSRQKGIATYPQDARNSVPILTPILFTIP